MNDVLTNVLAAVRVTHCRLKLLMRGAGQQKSMSHTLKTSESQLESKAVPLWSWF